MGRCADCRHWGHPAGQWSRCQLHDSQNGLARHPTSLIVAMASTGPAWTWTNAEFGCRQYEDRAEAGRPD